ncbi:hypothetical protein [Actinoplanes sp. NPDC089786]|uniref:hypothetical protein n=1 Tax=Actinoplanes sp. NPDC089786 TaxID=3155185 RepID=UPI0034457448
MIDVFGSAERFLLGNGRLVERRLFGALFRGAPASGVADAVRGYRNADGGFGHGMEPDTRCPASLPIYTEVAFQALAVAGVADAELLGPACDQLASVSDGDGAVALASPVIEDCPRAEHWSAWTYERGLNPTAGLAGRLHWLGFEHAWRDAATAYTWGKLEAGDFPDEAHLLAELMVFLEHVPDRERADRHAAAVVERLGGSELFQLDAGAEGYGLTPLTIAPLASSRWRALFGAERIGAHLDRLLADQQADGGWPIAWTPPSEAARLEWRGMWTLDALRTLISYGRVPAPR